ncbi:helix-turn-helix domain-containing protein [Enterococcus sp. AZ109]|uniref:helix-turn-helix domain-containing protein n=1 Tax=Enterococcus sp. AZ109 TaxID=2774634 RepID=UPI003F29466E
MTVFERIQELARKRDNSLQDVATRLNFSKNLFYRWKTTEPKAKDLEKVADYFNVSVDYLLGREDKAPITDNQSIARQIMLRSDTGDLSEEDAEDIEKEVERFLNWRLQEIKRERREKD